MSGGPIRVGVLVPVSEQAWEDKSMRATIREMARDAAVKVLRDRLVPIEERIGTGTNTDPETGEEYTVSGVRFEFEVSP